MARTSINVNPVTTTDATPNPVPIYTMPPDSSAVVLFYIVARTAAGVTFGGITTRVVKRVGTGNVGVTGIEVVLTSQKDAGAAAWTAVLGGSLATIICTVTGAAATTITWNISAEVITG